MRLFFAVIFCSSLSTFAVADTITLKDKTERQGIIESQTTDELRLTVEHDGISAIIAIPMSKIEKIEKGSLPSTTTRPSKTPAVISPPPVKPKASSPTVAQPAKLDGFWDMKFGSTVDECTKVMLARQIVLGTPRGIGVGVTACNIYNQLFATQHADIRFLFLDDKFASSILTIRKSDSDEAFDTAKTIGLEMKDKYGIPTGGGDKNIEWNMENSFISITVDANNVVIIYADKASAKTITNRMEASKKTDI